MGCASGGAGEDAGHQGHDASALDGSTSDDAGGPCTDESECDDGDACNGVETCTGGRCASGAAVDCDDTVSCTHDACDPSDGTCTHDLDDALCPSDLVCDATEGCTAPAPCTTDDDCDDHMLCNGVETCDPAFGCRHGDAPACDDGVACTRDGCDPSGDGGAGACTHTPDASACSDGRVCNGAESCDPTSASADALGCVAGIAPSCDDGIGCTTDGCDEGAGGCVSTPDPTSCQDGVFCNGAEVCDPTAGCVAGTPPSCEDAIGCTIGRCDAASDACVQAADPSFCADGLVCNGNEQCDITGTTPGRGCVPGVPVDCGDGLVCTTDMCNEPGGTCTHGGSDADSDGYQAVGCGSGNDCNDLSAAIHPGAAELCDGIDNDCSGTADDGGGMECALGSGARTCTTSCGSAGTRACTAACTLTPCVAATETCNDCDDNGNGLVDDGLACRRGTSAACTTSCGTSGTRVCASDCSGYGACVAATETCNDCDDNGNGLVDDGLACRRGSSTSCTTSCGTPGTSVCALDCSGFGACRAASESCNACDDDGNGIVDDGFACRQGATQACTTACGTAGVRTCASDCSGFGPCVATEVCNGCDDDADGAIDDGFTCSSGSSSSCTTGCGTAGTRACNATCTGYGSCVASEACNGCDDDGDGSADEDFACRQSATMGCTTSCGSAGVRTCSASCSGYGSCVATEVCNGCDDDGVSGPDNGFTCVQGSSRSCATSCGTTGTQTCNASCSGYGACTATEVCNGCDDDGVGGADNGFTCVRGATVGCTTACGTSGTQTCNSACSGYAACTATEVCNGCDDDGVGGADNGFTCVRGATVGCTTACGTSGTQTCNGTCSGYSACVAAAEVCGNGCDDNGNGSVDEGCGPANDLCGGAIALSGASGSRSDTLVGATAQTTDCGSGVEVFYAVTVASPSIVYLSTLGGATFDTRLSYRGTSCAGSAIQCVDDSCGTVQTHIAQAISAGTHYFAVHTYSSFTTPGAFTLSWRVVGTTSGDNVHVPDDDLPGAGTVQTYSGATNTTNALTPTDTASCGYSGSGASGEDVYYWAQCAETRNYSANLCSGTSYDSTLWFRLNGTQIACNDDSCSLQSSVSATATGAGIVQMVVDGYGTASGSYSVNLTL